MKCITFANDAYAPMVEKYLEPSAGAFEFVWARPQIKELSLYGSQKFREMVRNKPLMIRRRMEKTMTKGEVFLYVDGDIEFFGLTPQMILDDLGDGDIATHAEFPNYRMACTGVIAIRNNEFTRKLIEKWSTKTIWSDEEYFNELLGTEPEFQKRHRWLPCTKYWNVAQSGLGYLPWKEKVEKAILYAPKDIRLFHANFAVGLEEKTELLEVIRNTVIKSCESPALGV